MLNALCYVCAGDCVKVDLVGVWATLVLGQAKKATRTKGTRHDAVSDTLRVEKKKRHFSRMAGNTTRGAACISNDSGYRLYEPLNQQLFM